MELEEFQRKAETLWGDTEDFPGLRGGIKLDDFFVWNTKKHIGKVRKWDVTSSGNAQMEIGRWSLKRRRISQSNLVFLRETENL